MRIQTSWPPTFPDGPRLTYAIEWPGGTRLPVVGERIAVQPIAGSDPAGPPHLGRVEDVLWRVICLATSTEPLPGMAYMHEVTLWMGPE